MSIPENSVDGAEWLVLLHAQLGTQTVPCQGGTDVKLENFDDAVAALPLLTVFVCRTAWSTFNLHVSTRFPGVAQNWVPRSAAQDTS